MQASIFKLNDKQLEKMSDIAGDLGLVSLALIVLPSILDKFNLIQVVLGLIGTIVFGLLSIWLRR